jgi:CHAD domain-containing protein
MLALFGLMDSFYPREWLAEARKRFSKGMKTSGVLRDAHVQWSLVKNEMKRFPELAPFRKWLRRREERLTRRLKKGLQRGVKPKTKAVVLALRNWPDHEEKRANSGAQVFIERINASYGDLLKLRNAPQLHRPSTIHRLRIAFKAYRYMVELLKPEILRVPPQVLKQLRDYQAMMGDIQDVEVLQSMLGKFEKAKGKANLGAFRGELKRRHADLIQRFMAAPFPQQIKTPAANATAEVG